MPTPILMPALSPTMEEGKLAKWLKAEGDAIAAGDAIAEIETDKATMEVEAAEDGRLGKILVPEGTEGVKVNTAIALLLGEDEEEAALEEAEEAAAPPAKEAAKPAPEKAAEAERPEATERAEVQAKQKRAEKRPEAAPALKPEAKAMPAREGERIIASPLARRLASQAGLRLAAIEGSGPHGRIVKADVEAARAAAPRREMAVAPRLAAAVVPAGGVYTDVPHSTIRRIIAKRLVEAKQTIPHFYLTIDCEIDRLLELRKELNAKSDAYKLSVNDFIIRALALSLRRVPEANAVWMEEALRQYANVDVSVAVAIEGGLVTPVIRDADQKGLAAISNEMKQLSERARAKPMGLKPEEYQGGTTSVSNLGMYGVREFAGVINPPQATLLAVGEGSPRPVVKNGALSVATVMSCTLSCDHRVVDGALGARLLQVFKGFLEDPVTMLL